jgi:hypothetical protein
MGHVQDQPTVEVAREFSNLPQGQVHRNQKELDPGVIQVLIFKVCH